MLEIIRILDQRDSGKSVSEILGDYARLRTATEPDKASHEQEILSTELQTYREQLAQTKDKDVAIQ